MGKLLRLGSDGCVTCGAHVRPVVVRGVHSPKHLAVTLPAYAWNDPRRAPRERGTLNSSTPSARSCGCLVAGVLSFFILWGAIGVMSHRAHRISPGAACELQQRYLGSVLRTYAAKHEFWLPLSAGAGVLRPDWTAFAADRVPAADLLVCPSDSDVDEPAVAEGRSPGSYYYLGYVVRNERELVVFGAAYRHRIAEGGSFDGDLPISAEYGGGVIRRLSPSAISELAEEPNGADIPVLFERPDNHVPKGMNVLYADGHVEFLEFGTKFPAVQATIDLIGALERSAG